MPAEPRTTRPPAVTVRPDAVVGDQPPYCRFTLGDGVGGSETNERGLDPEQCFARCKELKKTNPRVNGVTVDTKGDKECYCEIGMKSWNTVDRYKSCQVKMMPVFSV